jgi:hypothetical protein
MAASCDSAIRTTTQQSTQLGHKIVGRSAIRRAGPLTSAFPAGQSIPATSPASSVRSTSVSGHGAERLGLNNRRTKRCGRRTSRLPSPGMHTTSRIGSDRPLRRRPSDVGIEWEWPPRLRGTGSGSAVGSDQVARLGGQDRQGRKLSGWVETRYPLLHRHAPSLDSTVQIAPVA